jgi:SAM-dependent methyltransferase
MGMVENPEATGAVARIHHAAVAASAISAAWELGALDLLAESGGLDVEEFADRNALDRSATLSLFRALAAVDIVERSGTKVAPGVYFAEAYRTRSFFHWLSRGSAEVFRVLPEILRQENRSGAVVGRDDAAIAFACDEISAVSYDPWFWRVVARLDFIPAGVADLGCGSGQRVVEMLRRYPNARGIGIDVATSALAMARTRAAAAGVDHRVAFRAGDVTRLETGAATFRGVELLTCFMMGHDLWPRPRCVEVLSGFRSVFPDVRRFILGDATRTVGVADRDLPIFALAFELAHDAMGAFIPTIEDWQAVFAEAGWSVRTTQEIRIAANEVIFELEPR